MFTDLLNKQSQQMFVLSQALKQSIYCSVMLCYVVLCSCIPWRANTKTPWYILPLALNKLLMCTWILFHWYIYIYMYIYIYTYVYKMRERERERERKCGCTQHMESTLSCNLQLWCPTAVWCRTPDSNLCRNTLQHHSAVQLPSHCYLGDV